MSVEKEKKKEDEDLVQHPKKIPQHREMLEKPL
jgi:hypothetical protein